MTTVAVMGASGRLGRHVVRDLHEHGYRVVALDRVPDEGSPAQASVRVEFTHHDQVLEAFTAVDDRPDGDEQPTRSWDHLPGRFCYERDILDT